MFAKIGEIFFSIVFGYMGAIELCFVISHIYHLGHQCFIKEDEEKNLKELQDIQEQLKKSIAESIELEKDGFQAMKDGLLYKDGYRINAEEKTLKRTKRNIGAMPDETFDDKISVVDEIEVKNTIEAHVECMPEAVEEEIIKKQVQNIEVNRTNYDENRSGKEEKTSRDEVNIEEIEKQILVGGNENLKENKNLSNENVYSENEEYKRLEKPITEKEEQSDENYDTKNISIAEVEIENIAVANKEKNLDEDIEEDEEEKVSVEKELDDTNEFIINETLDESSDSEENNSSDDIHMDSSTESNQYLRANISPAPVSPELSVSPTQLVSRALSVSPAESVSPAQSVSPAPSVSPQSINPESDESGEEEHEESYENYNETPSLPEIKTSDNSKNLKQEDDDSRQFAILLTEEEQRKVINAKDEVKYKNIDEILHYEALQSSDIVEKALEDESDEIYLIEENKILTIPEAEKSHSKEPSPFEETSNVHERTPSPHKYQSSNSEESESSSSSGGLRRSPRMVEIDQYEERWEKEEKLELERMRELSKSKSPTPEPKLTIDLDIINKQHLLINQTEEFIKREQISTPEIELYDESGERNSPSIDTSKGSGSPTGKIDYYSDIMEGISDFYDFNASINPSRSRSTSRNPSVSRSVSPNPTIPSTGKSKSPDQMSPTTSKSPVLARSTSPNPISSSSSGVTETDSGKSQDQISKNVEFISDFYDFNVNMNKKAYNTQESTKLEEMSQESHQISSSDKSQDFKLTNLNNSQLNSINLEPAMSSDSLSSPTLEFLQVEAGNFVRSTYVGESTDYDNDFEDLREQTRTFVRSRSPSVSFGPDPKNVIAGKKELQNQILKELEQNSLNCEEFSKGLTRKFLDLERRESDSVLLQKSEILFQIEDENDGFTILDGTDLLLGDAELEAEEYHHFRRFSLQQEYQVEEYPEDKEFFLEMDYLENVEVLDTPNSLNEELFRNVLDSNFEQKIVPQDEGEEEKEEAEEQDEEKEEEENEKEEVPIELELTHTRSEQESADILKENSEEEAADGNLDSFSMEDLNDEGEASKDNNFKYSDQNSDIEGEEDHEKNKSEKYESSFPEEESEQRDLVQDDNNHNDEILDDMEHYLSDHDDLVDSNSDDDRQTVIDVDDGIDEDMFEDNDRPDESYTQSECGENNNYDMDDYNDDRENIHYDGNYEDDENQSESENDEDPNEIEESADFVEETDKKQRDQEKNEAEQTNQENNGVIDEKIDQIYDDVIKDRRESGIQKDYDGIVESMNDSEDEYDDDVASITTDDIIEQIYTNDLSPSRFERYGSEESSYSSYSQGSATEYNQNSNKRRFKGKSFSQQITSTRLRSRYGIPPATGAYANFESSDDTDVNYIPKKEYQWRKNFKLDDDEDDTRKNKTDKYEGSSSRMNENIEGVLNEQIDNMYDDSIKSRRQSRIQKEFEDIAEEIDVKPEEIDEFDLVKTDEILDEILKGSSKHRSRDKFDDIVDQSINDNNEQELEDASEKVHKKSKSKKKSRKSSIVSLSNDDGNVMESLNYEDGETIEKPKKKKSRKSSTISLNNDDTNIMEPLNYEDGDKLEKPKKKKSRKSSIVSLTNDDGTEISQKPKKKKSKKRSSIDESSTLVDSNIQTIEFKEDNVAISNYSDCADPAANCKTQTETNESNKDVDPNICSPSSSTSSREKLRLERINENDIIDLIRDSSILGSSF